DLAGDVVRLAARLVVAVELVLQVEEQELVAVRPQPLRHLGQSVLEQPVIGAADVDVVAGGGRVLTVAVAHRHPEPVRRRDPGRPAPTGARWGAWRAGAARSGVRHAAAVPQTTDWPVRQARGPASGTGPRLAWHCSTSVPPLTGGESADDATGTATPSASTA